MTGPRLDCFAMTNTGKYGGARCVALRRTYCTTEDCPFYKPYSQDLVKEIEDGVVTYADRKDANMVRYLERKRQNGK